MNRNGRRFPVVIVGAGPVGLTLALRLAQLGIPIALYEQQPRHAGEGSKALCMQRETLEIWASAGVGEEVARRGVQWRTGRTYFRDRELFHVDLPATTADHFPPFVNISQTEVEELLLDRLSREPDATIAWGHRLTGLMQDDERVTASFETDAGATVSVHADYLVGADGAHSGVRHALGLEFRGYSFSDRFLICDVRAQLPYPDERRLFFDPPWNPGRQVLIHPQPDGVWRIDWQVPPKTDLHEERQSGRLEARIRAILGPDATFELVWATSYRFSQRVVDAFHVGRVFLAGDAAHLMAPFGARGLNSGVADAENLAWKLALVLDDRAPQKLLDTYDAERRAAALENLQITDATMRFMVPHGAWSRAWRNLVLRLAPWSDWFRRRVNSGRLAAPIVYAASPIIEPGLSETGLPPHGSVAPDVRLSDGGRLREAIGQSFLVLAAGADDAVAAAISDAEWSVRCRVVADASPEVRRVYAPREPRAWIIRPDAYVAASRPLGALSSPAEVADLVSRAAGR